MPEWRAFLCRLREKIFYHCCVCATPIRPRKTTRIINTLSSDSQKAMAVRCPLKPDIARRTAGARAKAIAEVTCLCIF